MIRHIDAIFSQGAFRPLEPLSLPEGTLVHLSMQETATVAAPASARIHTPKLANPEEVADFVMDVRETGDAGL
jgi:predicted DNA-binding antitoxin AbrB/MazE fold protein